MNRHIPSLLVLLLVCPAALWTQSSESSSSHQDESETEYGIAIDTLDTNGDGKVEPYEAADAIVQINLDAGSKQGLTILEMERQFDEWEKEDIASILEEFDENDDSAIEKDELDVEMRTHFDQCDSDQNQKLEGFEVLELYFSQEEDEEELFDEQSSMEAVEDIFEEFDSDQNGRLSSKEWLALDYSEMEDKSFAKREFLIADRDQSGTVDSRELQKYLLSVEGPVEFEIRDRTAWMSGVIDVSLPAKVIELIVEHPEVRTIKMGIVPGSMDDDANLRASRLIHRHKFKTVVADNGWIASGGVDFFLAGHQRQVRKGGRLGVHSWADEDGPGADRPNDSEDHQPYLDFYSAIGVSDDFYWYTLKIASPDEVHWLTEAELQKFGLLHVRPAGNRIVADAKDSESDETATFKVEPLPKSASKAMRAVFDRQVTVFDVPIFATAKTGGRKLQHAASVLAEYLDNDRDGNPDNSLVIEALKKQRGAILMFATEGESERAERRLRGGGFKWNPVALYDEETHPDGAQNGTFDASLEEIIHLITSVGYANAYPDAFGEKPGTKIADAMDKARGGRFKGVPKQYPKGAWYTYDDTTCDYGCMVTEYIYWGLTSILGAQDFKGRFEEIRNEWELNTREKVKKQDPALFKLLTDPRYKFPTKLPRGDYKVKS